MKVKNNQCNNSQNWVAIFWDYENVPQCEIASDLLKFASFKGNVLIRKAYSCNWNSKAENHLKEQGFECIQIENKNKIKNAVDHFLEVDCGIEIGKNPLLKTIILVTGDCYSQILQQNLKQENRKLIVFARKGSDCKSLNPKAFDEFHYIDELPNLVKKIRSEIIKIEAFICYEDAVNCLIQAIKTVVNSQKSATIGYLGKLMHDNPNFPNYKNVSLIRKPDGTKFSKFSQFLNKAIQEDRIPKVYHQIFLVNLR
jgi:hypothetical protein